MGSRHLISILPESPRQGLKGKAKRYKGITLYMVNMKKRVIPKGMYWDFNTQSYRKVRQSTAQKALKLAKQNKKKLGIAVEIVQGTTVTSTDPCNATPVVDYLPLAGSGLKTNIKSVQVKGTFAGTHGNNYRFDLVLDRDPDATEVTPALVYGAATPVIGAFKNITYKKRFKILRSQFGVHDTGKGLSDTINWYVKLNLIAESNTDNAWAQANIIKNAIYLIYWTTATSNQTVPALQSRVICADDS